MPDYPQQCFNDSGALQWLETKVKIVRQHPALLGYCALHSWPATYQVLDVSEQFLKLF